MLKNHIDINKMPRKDLLSTRTKMITNLLKNSVIEPFINIDNPAFSTTSINKGLYSFNDIMKQIGCQLKYIKSGSSGHTFRASITRDNGDISYCAIKVVAYPKKGYATINDVDRPENAELRMLKLLSTFVLKKCTPHIVLPICTFNTSIRPFTQKDYGANSGKNTYKTFLNRYKQGYYHDTVSILISEWADHGDFMDFIRKYYKQFSIITWKALFFQILSTLAYIQGKFPNFRHNDLKANNILVQSIQANKDKLFSYKMDGKKYILPNIGYQVRLWDFDFACIPGKIDNAKVSANWTTKNNVTPSENKYYDMHFLFNLLIRPCFFPDFDTDIHVPREVKNFIYYIVPKDYRNNTNYVSKRGRILIKDEYLTPIYVLNTNPFFDCFRVS